MFLFVIALTLNPHPDLWLGDTEFSLKYFPAEFDHLNACIRSLAEATAVPPQVRPGRRVKRALEIQRRWEEAAEESAKQLELSIVRMRDAIRSNPYFYTWPQRLTTPTTSGGL